MAKVLTEDEARCVASANRQPYCWRSLSETFGSLFQRESRVNSLNEKLDCVDASRASLSGTEC